MVDLTLTSAVMSIAGRAADLSSDLHTVPSTCGHDDVKSDIEAIAVELAALSSALWRLHEALLEDPHCYTESFRQDLSEILSELRLIFEDTHECCLELQKADDERNSAMKWLFKRKSAQNLQKHLDALMTTLVVMRTVLVHGKHFVLQK